MNLPGFAEIGLAARQRGLGDPDEISGGLAQRRTPPPGQANLDGRQIARDVADLDSVAFQ